MRREDGFCSADWGLCAGAWWPRLSGVLRVTGERAAGPVGVPAGGRGGGVCEAWRPLDFARCDSEA